MKFEWSQYIEVADSLGEIAEQRQENQEAFYRAGISRAYYAAFHMTKLAFDFESSFGSEHARLLVFLNEGTSQKKKKIRKILSRLKVGRVQADYHERPKVTKNDLQISLRDARKILEMLG